MASSFIPPSFGRSISESIIPDVKTTLNLFGIHWRKVDGEWSYPVHSHPQYEMNYVLEGEQAFIVNNKAYQQRAGDLVLLRPGALHASRSGNGKPFTYFCIHFDMDDPLFLSMLSRMEQVLFKAGTGAAEQLRPALLKLVELSRGMAEAEGTSFAKRMGLQAAVFELFGQLGEACLAESGLHFKVSDQKAELARHIQNRLQSMVFQQFKPMDAHANERSLGIADIAADLGISSSYCNRVFKQVFGMSPREYLSVQMLHEAKMLLSDPRLTVNQISVILGYRDIAHFSRQFKRWHGQAPTEFRRLYMDSQASDETLR